MGSRGKMIVSMGVPPQLAFQNGIVVDVRCFIEVDDVGRCIYDLDPNNPPAHTIPHPLRLDILNKIWIHDDNWRDLVEKYAPRTTEAFKRWTGPAWSTLYEIIGYTLYPANPLQKAFVIAGPISSGKSVYLRLLKSVLGGKNYSIVPQRYMKEGGQYMYWIVDFYRKLANINTENVDVKIRDPTTLEKLIVGEPVMGKVKYGPRIYFKNYAKIIIEANKVPKDLDTNLKRYFLVVRFPYIIPRNDAIPSYEEHLMSEADVVIPFALFALRDVMRRGYFTVENISYIDPVHVFLHNKMYFWEWFQPLVMSHYFSPLERAYLQPCECVDNGCASCRTPVVELYALYNAYRIEEGFPVMSKHMFTSKIKAMGQVAYKGKVYTLKHVRKGGRSYIGGIKLIKW